MAYLAAIPEKKDAYFSIIDAEEQVAHRFACDHNQPRNPE
jgi:hypothetical protein